MRRLTPSEHVVMDLLVRHPDWTNDELAAAMPPTKRYGEAPTVEWVKRLLRGAFEAYDVQTRGHAILRHDRAARVSRVRRTSRTAETAEMGL